MLEITLPDWMARGFQLVERGEVESVRIMDRRPMLVPEGGFGWQYGWRWLDGSFHTLPEAVFRRLPDCPYPEVVKKRLAGHGIMPRWPTEVEALQALDQAAFAWAKSLVERARLGPMPQEDP